MTRLSIQLRAVGQEEISDASLRFHRRRKTPVSMSHPLSSMRREGRRCIASVAAHDSRRPNASGGRSESANAGPNEVAQERRRGWFIRLLIILRNPLVILLAALSSISFATGDARAGTVMACMVVLSATLRFVQEARADAAAAKLKAMIHVTATVFRDGRRRRCRCAIWFPGTSSICTQAT